MISSQEFLKKIHDYSLCENLPSAKKILTLAKNAAKVLQTEDASYRPQMTLAEGAGGLLDFGKSDISCIVVPDIHARADFIFNVLNFVLPKNVAGFESEIRVLDALESEKIFVVLVGDLLHGEARVYERWLSAYEDFLGGNFAGSAMKAEMKEGLAAQMAVMECKCRFAKNFHCLKGNHENIKNETGGGNFAFRKFCAEGEMVFRFMQKQYGSEVLNAIYDFEKSLPLAFCAKNFFASHAEPAAALSRETVINAPVLEEAILALTWTANDEAETGSVKKMLDAFCEAGSGKAKYLGGHRPVRGKFNLRQDGLFVQIHNPMEQNVAFVREGKIFEPERDIFSVKK